MTTPLSHPLFAGLGAEAARAVEALATRVSHPAGTLLLREDEPATRVYLLVSGDVALEVHAPGAGPTRLETLGPGDVLGLSWLSPPADVHLDARALTPVDAWCVDAAGLLALMDRDHDAGYAIARRLLTATFDRLRRTRLARLDVFGKRPA